MLKIVKKKDLKKKREALNEEIATIEKYLELAKTLCRVEANKAKLASLSSQSHTDETGNPQVPITDVTGQARGILFGRLSRDVVMSALDAAYKMYGKPNILCVQRNHTSTFLMGAYKFEEKIQSLTSFKRDLRFRKVGPNIFEGLDEADRLLAQTA